MRSVFRAWLVAATLGVACFPGPKTISDDVVDITEATDSVDLDTSVPDTLTEDTRPNDGVTHVVDDAEPADTTATEDTTGSRALAVEDTAGVVIEPDGVFKDPALEGVPPYDQVIVALRLHNVSESPLVVNSVRLERLGETQEEDWAITDPGEGMRRTRTVDNETLAPNAAMPVRLLFRPIASGTRNVRLVVTFDDNHSYAVEVHASGGDNAILSPDMKIGWERLFGRSNVESSNSVRPGGLALDTAGAVFINVNASGWYDRFNDDVVVAKISGDGTLAWVKELAEAYSQESRDVGNNGEFGGGQDSLAVDVGGDVFVAAERSLNNNLTYQAFCARLDGASGAPIWSSGLTLSAEESPPVASRTLRASALDVSIPGRVLIVGQVADSGGALIAALDAIDGRLDWAYSLKLNGIHRVSSIAVDPVDGRAWLAGVVAGVPFVARIDDVDTDRPKLGWWRSYHAGLANVHALVRDGDALFIAIDVRGSVTKFVAARLSAEDGAVVWSKEWDDASTNDKNKALSVALHGAEVVFGGQIAIEPFDTDEGDGFLLALEPSRGSYNWGAFLHTGSDPQTLLGTGVTALVSDRDGLWLLAQQTPGMENAHHFWGRWYDAGHATAARAGDAHARLADAGITVNSTAGSPTLEELTDVYAHPISDIEAAWIDADADLTEPAGGERSMYQMGVHAVLQRLVGH